MTQQGQRQVDGFISGVRPQDYRRGIMLNYPNGGMPLLGLTSKLGSPRKVTDAEYHWFTKMLDARRMALGANLTTTNTEFTIVAGASGSAGALGVKQGDLLYVEQTGEIVRVSSDPVSDTVVSVQRAFGDTSAATVAYAGNGINPNIKVIGSAYEHGSSSPTGVNFDPVKKTNYCQIFRSSSEITRSAAETDLRTGDPRKEAKREALEAIGMDMEMALWLGKKNQTSKNGKPLYTCDGLIQQMNSGNIVTADTSTGTNFETLEGYLKDAFAYGSAEKFSFCGNTALLTIQRICRSAKGVAWTLQPEQSKFGMNVNRLVCPFGTVILKTHPLFNRITGGTTGSADYFGMDSWMSILDMNDLKYVTFRNNDIKFEDNLQTAGVDGSKIGFIAEASIQMSNPENHYLIKNLAKGKAE